MFIDIRDNRDLATSNEDWAVKAEALLDRTFGRQRMESLRVFQAKLVVTLWSLMHPPAPAQEVAVGGVEEPAPVAARDESQTDEAEIPRPIVDRMSPLPPRPPKASRGPLTLGDRVLDERNDRFDDGRTIW